jgi:hypothetical protein
MPTGDERSGPATDQVGHAKKGGEPSHGTLSGKEDSLTQLADRRSDADDEDDRTSR